MKQKTNHHRLYCLSQHFDYLLAGSLIATTLVAGAFLSSRSASADDTTTHQVSVTVPISCSLATFSGSGTYSASIANGTSGEITGSTFKATCNDNGGYAIYAIGFSGDSYTDATHTTMIGSPSTIGNIATGTATSGATSNWGMWLTTESGGAYPITITNGASGTENFTANHVVPSTYTKVAYRDSATDIGANATGSLLTTHYKAYMSGSQPAGTYTGQVKYTLVHPATETPLMPVDCPSGYICYNPNGGNVVGTMGQQPITSSVTYATLLASNFSREGYGFAGWSDAYDYATNSNAHFYGPQEEIAFTAGQYTDNNDGLALYAVWVKSAGSLQSNTASVCSNLTTAPTDGTANLASISALTDQRDNETYAIAKLADGNCWMIENFRLDNTNSDNSTGTLAQGYGTSTTYGNFSGLANPEATWDSISDDANSLYSTNGSNSTINIGTFNAAYRFPRYSNINTPTTASSRPQNPTTNSATNSTSNASMYSYGNYYTWHATIADTTDYTSGDHSSTSICPTGWQIPLGGTSTGNINQGANDPANKVPGFSYLDRKMGGSGQTQSTSTASRRWRKYPNNLVYSGDIHSDYADRGTYGSYWSSTANSSSNAYQLYLNSISAKPGTSYDYKYNGYTIRCVFNAS